MISSVASLYYSARDSLYSTFPAIVWVIFLLEFLQYLIMSGTEATLFAIVEHFNLPNKLTVLILHSSMFVRGIFFMFGGWLADSYLGKFSVYMTSLVLICVIVCPLSCINYINIFTMDQQKIVFIVTLYTFSLLLFGFSCKVPLYNEQFFLPVRERELRTFTIVLFWIKNLSSLIGGLAVPLIVKNHSCFEMDCCLGWPVIVGAALTLFHLLVLALVRRGFLQRGLFTYKSVEKTIDVLVYSFFRRLKRKRKYPDEVNHFLDYGEERYESYIVNGAKRLLSLLLLFVSFLTFWATRAQLNVIWTVQTMYLKSTNFFKYFAPQQIGLMNPLFNLILIPSVYTLFTRKWHNYLYHVGIGFTCMCIAAVISAILQDQVERFRIAEPFDIAHLRIYNTLSQQVTVDCSWIGTVTFDPFQMRENLHLHVRGTGHTVMKVKIGDAIWVETIEATKDESVSYLIREKKVTRMKGYDPIKLRYHMKPIVYFMCGLNECSNQSVQLLSDSYRETKRILASDDERTIFVLKHPGGFIIELNDRETTSHIFNNGGIYSGVIVNETGAETTIKIYQVMTENTITLYWIVPQFLMSSLADTFTWISIDMFVYTQSPTCLRAFTRSLYLAGQSFGSGVLASSFVSSGFHYRDFMILFCVISFSFLLLFLFLSVKYIPKMPSDSL